MLSESILEGEITRLRPVQPSDLPYLVEWLQDGEVRRWLAALQTPPTLEEEIDWYESTRENPDNLLWAMETTEGRLAGTIELRVAPHANRAELGIAIMDKALWSQGLGTDAIQSVLKFAFTEANLNRVELTTDETNARGLRCYEKCGFVREGLLREHRIVEGKYVNTVMMSILRSEWKGARRRQAAGRGAGRG
jgi:RimJ/RimL family protein N-acetyltransferase